MNLRPWFTWRLLLFGLAAIVVVLIVLPATETDVPTGHDQDLLLSFELSEKAATGSYLADVCWRDRDAAKPSELRRFIEFPDGSCAERKKDAGAASVDKRPAIVSSALDRDMSQAACRRARSTSELRASEGSKFPADQITVVSELTGTTSIQVHVSADPASPVLVEPGAYCGQIIIERASGGAMIVPVVALLDKRGGLNLGKAAALLAFGAVVGVLIRMLNDPIGPLVPIYRRYRLLRRQVDRRSDGEAKTLRETLDDAQVAITMLDVASAKELLKRVEDFFAAEKKAPPAAASILEGLEARATLRASRPEGGRLFWVLDRYWVVAMIAIVVIVVASGVWTQYLQDSDFRGTSREWVSLVIFGLAAQVTVTGITEALGKLSPSASPPSTS